MILILHIISATHIIKYQALVGELEGNLREHQVTLTRKADRAAVDDLQRAFGAVQMALDGMGLDWNDIFGYWLLYANCISAVRLQ